MTSCRAPRAPLLALVASLCAPCTPRTAHLPCVQVQKSRDKLALVSSHLQGLEVELEGQRQRDERGGKLRLGLKQAQEDARGLGKQLVAERHERKHLEARLAHVAGELAALEARCAGHAREQRAKETLLKELRQRLEAAREAEAGLQQQAAQAEERAKAASADAARKDRLVIEMRARLEHGEASLAQVRARACA